MFESLRFGFDALGSTAAVLLCVALWREARRLPRTVWGSYFRWLGGFLCLFAASRFLGHAVVPLAVRAGFSTADTALNWTGALNSVVFTGVAVATWSHRQAARAEGYLVREKDQLRADLARSQTALQDHTERLQWAVNAARDALRCVVEQGDYSHRFPNPAGVRCWEHFRCEDPSCPAFRNPSDRCWRLRGGVGVERPCRGESCRECPVRRAATADEIADLAEVVNDLLHLLEGHAREEALYRSAISHDIQSPMASLNGFLGLLTETPPGLSDKQAELLELARFSVRRVLHLAENLVLEGRAQSRALEPRRRTLDLREMADRLVRETAPQASLRQVSLAWSPDSLDRCPAEVDALMIARAYANLLDNALKHVPRGTRVTLHLERRGERVRLGVEDRGPGVPEARREEIFQPFRQFSEKGTGLGLYVVSSVCQAHGGRAWVEAPPEGGALFWMEIPAAAAAEPSPGTEETDGPTEGPR